MRGALAVLALALSPALTGCLGGADGMVVVASAPTLANGLTVAVAVPRTLLDGGGEYTAHYWVSHAGRVVYPLDGGPGVPLALKEGQGSAFVPYQAFVVENGDYTVTVDLDGKRRATTVPVEKWVRWVWPFAYLRDNKLLVELVLEGSNGEPNHRIFAEGQLNVEIRYRGTETQSDNRLRLTRTLTTDAGQSFQRLEFPVSSFKSQSGYYSVEATFHNFQAQGNNNVGLDPALGHSRPPVNWVRVR